MLYIVFAILLVPNLLGVWTLSTDVPIVKQMNKTPPIHGFHTEKLMSEPGSVGLLFRDEHHTFLPSWECPCEEDLGLQDTMAAVACSSQGEGKDEREQKI